MMDTDRTTHLAADASLRSKVRGTTADIAAAGDLDMAAAFRFESELEAVLDAGSVESLALDFSDVTFIDSAGIGALLSVRDRANDRGIDLTIERASDAVRRTLELTGLSDLVAGDRP
jgi:anti-anti-sigma factor